MNIRKYESEIKATLMIGLWFYIIGKYHDSLLPEAYRGRVKHHLIPAWVAIERIIGTGIIAYLLATGLWWIGECIIRKGDIEPLRSMRKIGVKMKINTKYKVGVVLALIFFIILDIVVLPRYGIFTMSVNQQGEPPAWVGIIGVLGLIASGSILVWGIMTRCPACAAWWAVSYWDLETNKPIYGKKQLRGVSYGGDPVVVWSDEEVVIGHMRQRDYSCKYCRSQHQKTYDPRTPPTF